MGVWQKHWLAAVIASISIVVTAAYVLLVIRRVFFGEMPKELEGHIGPATAHDKVAIVTLCAFMVLLGLFPVLMTPMVSLGVENILRILGGA
jgi:NADH-quinone oxidoreductase subunit M